MPEALTTGSTEWDTKKAEVDAQKDKLEENIVSSLAILESSEQKNISIQMPVVRVTPEITTEAVNNMGISKLIGYGSSQFRGSIASRVYNINLASSNLNGVLIESGKIFSLNETLGDVSTLTGYKQAYIIKEGKTILGDGGGVCQVSTTLFRAALDAGLPIFERMAHAYRVGYYEQGTSPGLDATVYSPTTDFKFKNDTPGYILIQTLFDSKNAKLVFEFYGTDDGRIATTTKPVVTNVVPPPEDLYTDDPNLPIGTIKQIERKSWGAKVWFDYTVERNGEVVYEKRFYSNYQPWQAVYIRGTGNNTP